MKQKPITNQFKELLETNPGMMSEVDILEEAFSLAVICPNSECWDGSYRVNNYPVEVVPRYYPWTEISEKFFDKVEIGEYRIYWHKAGFYKSLDPDVMF